MLPDCHSLSITFSPNGHACSGGEKTTVWYDLSDLGPFFSSNLRSHQKEFQPMGVDVTYMMSSLIGWGHPHVTWNHILETGTTRLTRHYGFVQGHLLTLWLYCWAHSKFKDFSRIYSGTISLFHQPNFPWQLHKYFTPVMTLWNNYSIIIWLRRITVYSN